LLEEFAFQLSISSTFVSQIFENDNQYWDMQYFLRVLSNRRHEDEMGTGEEELGEMGVSHEFFDYIFRLSFLRKRTPLAGWHLEEADRILGRLQNWVPPEITSQRSDHKSAQGLLRMAELYRVGCLIISTKVLHPSADASNASIRGHVQTALQLIQDIKHNSLQQASVLIWPLFMIGVAAVTSPEREACQQVLEYLLDYMGIGCIRSVLYVLSKAWEPGGVGESTGMGLDVLFRDDLLGQILF
jgi:hypothetical protein